MNYSDELEALNELLARRKARTSLLDFIRYCWWMPHDLVEGRHTRFICRYIDRAIRHWENGHSTYALIAVPFRHGKSDIISRALPPYFLGRCQSQQPDIIMSGYGAGLVEGFSKDAKKIMREQPYRNLFPDVHPEHGHDSVQEWRVDGSSGKVTATGLGGSITGKGGHLITLDDYCRSRKEAQSKTFRDSTWQAFKDDLMTRRAPASIVIVCATPWHVDDIRGRIKKAVVDNPDFPRFADISFPAKQGDGYLFPERFDDKWYREQYATLGSYGAAGLMDCNPVQEGGNLCKREWFEIVNAAPASSETLRSWDLAATAKTTADYTVGTKISRAKGIFYIEHIARGQVDAGSVKDYIKQTAAVDGKRSKIYVPQDPAAAGKILSHDLISALAGYAVRAVPINGDKVTLAIPFLSQAQAGNVKLVRGPWNEAWLDEFTSFPDGEHDDQVDSCTLGFNQLTERRSTALVF